jgi:hypothetical protein
MGKVNFHMISIFPHNILMALSVVLVAGCEGDLAERLQSGRVLALQGLQGRWVGPVVPVDTSCGQVTQGLMSIGKGGFGFDPFQSSTVIQGSVGEDGRLTGGLSQRGGDRHDPSISFEGAAAERGSTSETIEGALTSGRCRWKVTLRRG